MIQHARDHVCQTTKVDPLPATSSPRAPGPSMFTFAEPTPENVSADSNFTNMNVDGNATISAEQTWCSL